MPANCRSRSTSATGRSAAASETARIALVSVLPIPPFGPSTQISGDSALAPELAAPLRRATAFSTAKRSCSAALPISGPIVAGRTTRSSVPASKACLTKPFGRRAGQDEDGPLRAPLGGLGAGGDHQHVLLDEGVAPASIDLAEEAALLRQEAVDGIGSSPSRRRSSVTSDIADCLAPACARRTIHTLPLSDANASSGMAFSGRRSVTFCVCEAEAPRPLALRPVARRAPRRPEAASAAPVAAGRPRPAAPGSRRGRRR